MKLASIAKSPDHIAPPAMDKHSGPKIPIVSPTSQKTTQVVYIIDQLRKLGGAERILTEMVRRLPPTRFTCSVVTFDLDPTFESLKDLPAQVYHLPLKRTYDLNAAKMAVRLGRLIRRQNTSIVHTFFETSDLWAAPIAKFSGCPILISSRRDMGILRSRKHHLAYPLVNRLFDRVLAVSNEVRSFCIQKDHLSPRRIETVYNGIDIEELETKAAAIDARRELRLSPDVPIVSVLANIRRIKGIDVFVRAARRVREEFPEAVFLVVGSVLEPETMSELRAELAATQLNDNFHFVGGLSNPFPLLRASNVFCLPSRNEGFSNALVQAMACSLPCVATRVGGNAEALEEGKSGYLVASEDVDAMADRILVLLRDALRARRMGEAGRETVKARFTIDAMMNRLVDIYEELLAEKHV